MSRHKVRLSGPSQRRGALITLPAMATKAASLADDLVQRFEQQIEKGDMPPGARFPTEKAITARSRSVSAGWSLPSGRAATTSGGMPSTAR